MLWIITNIRLSVDNHQTTVIVKVLIAIKYRKAKKETKESFTEYKF